MADLTKEQMQIASMLIEEINDEALNKYIEEMQKAMEQLDPKQIQQAMENLNMSAEDLLKSLERTESLLREIQREQAVDGALKQSGQDAGQRSAVFGHGQPALPW